MIFELACRNNFFVLNNGNATCFPRRSFSKCIDISLEISLLMRKGSWFAEIESEESDHGPTYIHINCFIQQYQFRARKKRTGSVFHNMGRQCEHITSEKKLAHPLPLLRNTPLAASRLQSTTALWVVKITVSVSFLNAPRSVPAEHTVLLIFV